MIKYVSEGEQAPSWYFPIQYSLTQDKWLYAPFGVHWLIRIYWRIWLSQTAWPKWDRQRIHRILQFKHKAEHKGYNQGWNAGFNASRRGHYEDGWNAHMKAVDDYLKEYLNMRKK